MDSIERARGLRAQRLHEAQAAVQLLIEFVRKRAHAVDGEDREQLAEIAHKPETWSEWLICVGTDGVLAASVPLMRLIELAASVAGAGAHALQILGGRLARPEPWAGPFSDDDRDEFDDGAE